jgi:hypothetical protein
MRKPGFELFSRDLKIAAFSRVRPTDQHFLDQLAAKLSREFGLSIETARARVRLLAISAQPRPIGDGPKSRST